MSEYVPTTDEVRSAYHYYGKYPELAPDDNTVTGAEFDRWLGAILLQARNEGYMLGLKHGWDEGFEAGERDVMQHESWNEPCIKNPYRKEQS